MRTQHNIPQFCSFAGHSIKRSGISKSVIRSSFFGFFGLLLVTRLLPAQEAATESLEARLERGKVIYQNLCASCHGELGEGVPGQYENALTGDSTIGQLTELIEKTMPKDEADKCVGADAALVSEYIHHRFYSEAAQIRNRPPRLGLARLTGPQLRQSIADLYGHFQEQVWVSDKTGASAIYFDGDRWKDENKKLERVDPRIQFDFGKSSPVEGLDPKKFYIHWSGAIRPEETGRYEIIVRSTCSFVMDLGRHGRVFIDNHVQSGDKTEFRESIQLTAGRVYPFKIDFIQRERKTEQPPASITLAWVPPKGVEETIPERCLIPTWVPPTYSLQASLPPDDRSYGFDRGIAINREWEESTTAVAFEFAQVAIDELWPAYRKKHEKDSNENRGLVRGFLEELATIAYRGPLDAEQRTLVIDQQLAAEPDDAEAIRRSVLVTLKSPRFLYPTLDRDRSVSQRQANRLTLTMFDSLPSDAWLLEKIGKGELESEQQVREAAWRMLNDYRTHAKAQQMMHEWLNIRHIADLAKDQEAYPGFSPALVADMRNSLDAFLREIVWSESSDFRQLYLADWSYTSPRLAEFYGSAWAPESVVPESGWEGELRKSVRDANMHLGVLNHPFLMSGLAYHKSTSPIHRGVFLIRYMLGRTLRPPDTAVAPLSPDLHPDLTTRERVNLQTSPENCQVCHIKINGLGYTLENFDAVGRYREMEKGRPIDSSGEYVSTSGELVKMDRPRQLAEFMASSRDAQRGFVMRAFQYFVKQPVAAYGPDALDELTQKFIDSQFNIKQLIVEIAVLSATRESSGS